MATATIIGIIIPTTPITTIIHKHSTVWDGDETLFDINFLAMGIPPDEAWRLARGGGRELKVRQELRCFTPRRGPSACSHGPSGSRTAPTALDVGASSGPTRG